MSRKIIHVDCDCFYAAVEVRDDPRLRGRPVAVGGDPQRRGVIATCNYPAREFGVRSAMASSQALRLCPELVILPPDFDKYRRVSGQIQDIFRTFTNIIEPLSLDEAFLDVTESPLHANSATRIAEAIRRKVRETVNITVSAGVAPNKFLAKVASDWRKPDGLFVITPDQVDDFVAALTGAGVDFRYFDPRPRLFGYRTNALRRLHRKLVIVDRHHAFVGGINFSLEHLVRYGAKAKQDYAVEVQGPIVEHVRALALALLENRRLPRSRPWWRSRAGDPPAGDGGEGIATKLIWRDNDHHRDDIEIHYRWAIRKARHEIVIANAYFFPGYRLMRDLRRAARRGVRVLLILQGRSDQPVASWAARSLYAQLMRAGVQIYEYCRRPLHGKVAVVDGRWSTVGSSNLDPSSLSLNLEANLVFDDRELASDLRRRLQVLVDEHCERIDPGQPPPQPLWRRLAAYLAFHIIRRVPTWDRWLPQREQGAVPAQPPEPTPEPATAEEPPGAADVQSDEPSPPSKCAS